MGVGCGMGSGIVLVRDGVVVVVGPFVLGCAVSSVSGVLVVSVVVFCLFC